jgi:ATP-dependent RNA helicase DDX21
MQQKIFGKTIVFTQTKREADELVSGGIFKSLTAQALHGDVGQKQRDATLNAFRQGAFNVLVATDVAARGIDIQDVDLVIQFDPPRDVDTYVHRSGRTGRAGNKGVSVLLFSANQARDIVRIERDLGHGFKFELAGPPSVEAALNAAAKTSAIACREIPEETAQHFTEAAKALLAGDQSPEEIVSRCLAAISRRATTVQSRSLLTGELGYCTVEMKNKEGQPLSPRDVMFTVGKLSRLSQDGDLSFDSTVGKVQSLDAYTAVFDMDVEDAKNLIEFSQGLSAGGAQFTVLKELEIERDHKFGQTDRFGKNRDGGGYPSRNGGGYQGRSGGGYSGRSGGGNQGRSGGGYSGRSGGGYQGQSGGGYLGRSGGGREGNGYENRGASKSPSRRRESYQTRSDGYSSARPSGGDVSGGGRTSYNRGHDDDGW